MSKSLSPNTRLEELPLKPVVLRRLDARGLKTLGDVSLLSVDELRNIPDIGALTAERIRSALSSVGLEFQEPADPLRRAKLRADKSRQTSFVARRLQITDAAPVCDLGLKWNTVRRCLDHQVCTVFHLRQLTRADVHARFSPRQAADIFDRFRELGLQLALGSHEANEPWTKARKLLLSAAYETAS